MKFNKRQFKSSILSNSNRKLQQTTSFDRIRIILNQYTGRRLKIYKNYKISHNIEAELVGGLGNQLFIFFAAYYHSKVFSKKLVLDLTYMTGRYALFDSDIRAFNFMDDFTVITKGKANLAKLFLDKITRKSNLVRLLRYRIWGIYTGDGLGYDRNLEIKEEIKRLQGYFQTYKYYLNILHLDNIPKLELKKESEWFINLKKIMLSKPIIVIHIRRGDYNKVSSSMGMLGQDYYSEAIHQIRKTLPEGEFWIFSDDTNAAQQILYGIEMDKCTWISPPTGTDAAESLVLMSFGKAIITANSSFSWWAAVSEIALKMSLHQFPGSKL